MIKEKILKGLKNETRNDWNHVYDMQIIDYKTTLLCVGILCLPLLALLLA